jgi:hypothetical protein
MTTPNQGKPEYGTTFDDYAYEIGGGPWQYGSTLDQDAIELIIHGTVANQANSEFLFQDKLLQLPLEVLRLFQGFIPGTSMDVDGKRGNASLRFRFLENGQLVGYGEKRMVLSGLREYEEGAMQRMVDEYARRKESRVI